MSNRAALIVALLVGCAALPAASGPRFTSSCTTVVWLAPDQIKTVCAAMTGQRDKEACASVGTHEGSFNTIWAVKPDGFHDGRRLRLLGEEFLHNLGARHQ